MSLGACDPGIPSQRAMVSITLFDIVNRLGIASASPAEMGNYMSAILEHHRHGSTVVCPDCVCQNGIWLVPCSGGAMCDTPVGYLKGNKPPNYPVPALRTTDYVNLGYVSALNNFPLDAVWRLRQAMKR